MARPRLHRAAIATASVSLVLLGAAAYAAPLTGASLCSANKAKAAGRTMVCLAKEQNLELYDARAADFENCFAKLADALAKAEAPGACAVTGDLATARVTFTAAAEEVFAISGGTTAITEKEKACASLRNRVAARYASCRGKAWARQIANDPYDNCGYQMGGVLLKSLRNGCPDDDGDLALAEGPAAAYLPGVDFSQIGLTGYNMQAAVLYRANFSGTTMEYAILHHADLTSADFTNANLYTADLRYADATDADFTGARIGSIQFTGGIGVRATFVVPGMNNSSFVRADLTDSIFLTGTIAAVDFTDADLSGATIDVALFRKNNLTGVDLAGATLAIDTWDEVTCPDGTNSDDNGNTCCGHHVGGAPAACGI